LAQAHGARSKGRANPARSDPLTPDQTRSFTLLAEPSQTAINGICWLASTVAQTLPSSNARTAVAPEPLPEPSTDSTGTPASVQGRNPRPARPVTSIPCTARCVRPIPCCLLAELLRCSRELKVRNRRRLLKARRSASLRPSAVSTVVKPLVNANRSSRG
jgi:hypothetical protein